MGDDSKVTHSSICFNIDVYDPCYKVDIDLTHSEMYLYYPDLCVNSDVEPYIQGKKIKENVIVIFMILYHMMF